MDIVLKLLCAKYSYLLFQKHNYNIYYYKPIYKPIKKLMKLYIVK